jgi:hypothetical protein
VEAQGTRARRSPSRRRRRAAGRPPWRRRRRGGPTTGRGGHVGRWLCGLASLSSVMGGSGGGGGCCFGASVTERRGVWALSCLPTTTPLFYSPCRPLGKAEQPSRGVLCFFFGFAMPERGRSGFWGRMGRQPTTHAA